MEPISMGIMGGLSLYQMISGMQQRKKAQQQANEYKRTPLYNAYKDMQIDTTAVRNNNEQTNQIIAQLTRAAQMGGSRAILGSLPQIQAMGVENNRRNQEYLTNQQLRKEQLIAQDEARIQQMKEARDMQNLQGIGGAYASGTQQVYSGLQGLVSTANSYAGMQSEKRLQAQIDALRPVNDTMVQGDSGTVGQVGDVMYGNSVGGDATLGNENSMQEDIAPNQQWVLQHFVPNYDINPMVTGVKQGAYNAMNNRTIEGWKPYMKYWKVF